MVNSNENDVRNIKLNSFIQATILRLDLYHFTLYNFTQLR